MVSPTRHAKRCQVVFLFLLLISVCCGSARCSVTASNVLAGNYGHCVMTSNNDCCVRLFDVEGARPRQRLPFPFAVNYATLRPAGATLGGGAVAAVVGDDPVAWLMDLRSGLAVGWECTRPALCLG